MKTFVIEHVGGSKVPFRIKARNVDEALDKVSRHMGCPPGIYRVIRIDE